MELLHNRTVPCPRVMSRFAHHFIGLIFAAIKSEIEQAISLVFSDDCGGRIEAAVFLHDYIVPCIREMASFCTSLYESDNCTPLTDQDLPADMQANLFVLGVSY